MATGIVMAEMTGKGVVLLSEMDSAFTHASSPCWVYFEVHEQGFHW